MGEEQNKLFILLSYLEDIDKSIRYGNEILEFLAIYSKLYINVNTQLEALEASNYIYDTLLQLFQDYSTDKEKILFTPDTFNISIYNIDFMKTKDITLHTDNIENLQLVFNGPLTDLIIVPDPEV